MTQQVLNNLATLLEQRGKINANFAELYALAASLGVQITAVVPTTDVSLAELAAPSAPTLASLKLLRTPTGAMALSDGSRLLPVAGTPRSLSIVLFQSSGGARGNAVVDVSAGGIVGDGSLLTVNTDTNLLLHTGAKVLLGASTGGTGSTIDGITVLGTITRTGTKQFTMPYSGPAGTTTVKFDLLRQEQYGPPSIFREMNRCLGGQLNRLATWCVGGQNTVQKLSQVASVIALEPDVVYGDMGANNDLLDNTPVATTVANITSMVQQLIGCGIRVWFPLPPAITTGTAGRLAKSMTFIEAMRALARRYPTLTILDQFTATVNPATGLSYPNLIADAAFHQSQEGAQYIGQLMAESVQAAGLVSANWPEFLVTNAMDRRSQDATSNQLYEGGWSASGTDASTLDSKATGTVDAGVADIVTTGNVGRSFVCSLVPRADGMGYDTVGVFSGGVNDTVTINFAGPAGALLQDRIEAGGTYDIGLDYSIYAAPGVIASWEMPVDAILSYPGASNAYGRPSAYSSTDVNAAEPAMSVPSHGKAYFPRFTLPAGLTAASAFAITLKVTTAQAGVATLRVGRITVRKVV